MRYETFLFTRNQRQDFTAFIRPALLTNKDVSAIGGIFNYITDISRLTPDFPSLYCFPLGEYILLLRHYCSERKHAGRAIGVIEGVAVKKDVSEFGNAVSQFVDQQATLLNVSAAVGDIETLEHQTSPEQEWRGRASRQPPEPYVGAFLERREQDRLFLPFTVDGRRMLVTVLADRRIASPVFFAFGTNSDVLAQLSKHGQIDIASFFKTDRASFRNRRTNSVSGNLDEDGDDTNPDPSMSLRHIIQDERNLRPRSTESNEQAQDVEADLETLVGSNSVSIRSFQSKPIAHVDDDDRADDDHDDGSDSTILTMRQLRDQKRAEEAANQPAEQEQPSRDPIHWLLNLVSSIFSPNKPK